MSLVLQAVSATGGTALNSATLSIDKEALDLAKRQCNLEEEACNLSKEQLAQEEAFRAVDDMRLHKKMCVEFMRRRVDQQTKLLGALVNVSALIAGECVEYSCPPICV